MSAYLGLIYNLMFLFEYIGKSFLTNLVICVALDGVDVLVFNFFSN